VVQVTLINVRTNLKEQIDGKGTIGQNLRTGKHHITTYNLGKE